jgi:tRNA(Ile)-lysidine synthetase-like protein
MILAEIERWLGRHGVTRAGEERVLVACSGGRDSTVLAYAAAELLGARRVVAGHVDHAVRPGSERDADHVRAFAASIGAEAASLRLAPDTDAEAELRERRYAALEAMRAGAGAKLILTAHHASDQAETVLLQLVRSTEIGALRGIERWRDPILRPLLDVSCAEIASYAARHGLSFADDPSNLEPRYLRNRIRKELLPLLELRYRPRIVERLAAMVREPSTSLRGRVEEPEHDASHSGWGGALTLRLEPWPGPMPDGRREAVFDAGALEAPIVRALKEGDRIQPFGMQGRSKVSEVVRARGVAVVDRWRMPIVVDAEDRVVWVPGVLRSALAPVTLETTRVWRLTWAAE